MKSLVTGKQIHRGDLPEVPEQEGVESVLLISDCTPCFLAEVTGRNVSVDNLFHIGPAQILHQVCKRFLSSSVAAHGAFHVGVWIKEKSLEIHSRCSG